MALLNYSTSVAVEKTVGEIQSILSRHKCRGVQTRYSETGEITALAFTLQTDFGEREYAMPVNVEGVAQTLKVEKNAGRLNGLPWNVIEHAPSLRAQAARVAWRILKDWLEAQLAIVQSRSVTFEQVMLPYMLVESEEGMKTVFEVFQAQAALPPPQEEKS